MHHAAATAAPIIAPWLGWIPGLPLLAFGVLILVGRRLGRLAPWLSIAALATGCGLTLAMAPRVFHGDVLAVRWAWLSLRNPAWDVGLTVDGLSWVMLFVVTFVGTMIQLYSVGYMHGDARYSRFFAYLSLFCAAMLTLVLADHFILLFVGWEGVGLCSYLLISFWFEKPAAAAAGRKAFITTRIGDTGLLVGMLLLYWSTRDLRFASLGAAAAHLPAHLLTWISGLIFLGAMGKSAQFPLHVWLPDAMEGPTSVSALIHAATMVAAGVYLVARTFPLFTPQSLAVVFAIGLLTHLFASTIALTMTDIKRVLAYSTLSHLGLMMAALGLGAVTAAMLHLYTHAFFKALLFLAAGSVIHATHEQDLEALGGLGRHMPWTRGVFLLGALSMAGAPFFSGFWSKDAILLAAEQANPFVMWLLAGSAVMTAGYALRLYFRCFHGEAPHAPKGHSRHHGHHEPHESPAIMVAPMAVLALGAIVAGWAGSPVTGSPFYHLVGDPHAHEHLDVRMLVLSSVILAVGGWLAWTVGFRRRNLVPAPIRPVAGLLYRLAFNKYYIDELYGRFIIGPYGAITRWLARFDLNVIDGAVNGSGIMGWQLGQVKAWFDRVIVDGAVNGTGVVARALGSWGRRVQTGAVQQYLLIMVGAVVVLALLFRR